MDKCKTHRFKNIRRKKRKRNTIIKFFSANIYLSDGDAEDKTKEKDNYNNLEFFDFNLNKAGQYNDSFFHEYIKQYIKQNLFFLRQISFDWNSFEVIYYKIITCECISIEEQKYLICGGGFVLFDSFKKLTISTLLILDKELNIITNLQGFNRVNFLDKDISILDDEDLIIDLFLNDIDELFNSYINL